MSVDMIGIGLLGLLVGGVVGYVFGVLSGGVIAWRFIRDRAGKEHAEALLGSEPQWSAYLASLVERYPEKT